MGPRRYDGTNVTAAASATYHAIATPAARARNRGSVRAAMASAQAGTTIEPPMTTNCTALAAIAPTGAPYATSRAVLTSMGTSTKSAANNDSLATASCQALTGRVRQKARSSAG